MKKHFINLLIFIQNLKYRNFIKETKNGGLITENTKQEMYSIYNKAIAKNDFHTSNWVVILLAEYYKMHGEIKFALDLLHGYNFDYNIKNAHRPSSRYSMAQCACTYLTLLLIIGDIDGADRIYNSYFRTFTEFVLGNSDVGYNIRVTLIEYFLNKHDGEFALDLIDNCPKGLMQKHYNTLTLFRAAALAELRRFDEAENLLSGIEHRSKEYLTKQINELKCGNIQHIYDNTERN